MKFEKKKLLSRTIPFSKILPSMVTLVGLIIGVSSIRYALEAAWEQAVYCILIATIVDGIDGKIARMLNAVSKFGAELDSLCDFVNFGLCPALITYLWSFQQYEYKVISWASIMFFVVCMAIRLARFNIIAISEDTDLISKQDKNFFMGVPAPAGAILALIPIILDFEITSKMENFRVREHTLYIDLYIAIIACLLACRLPTISLKNLRVKPEYLSLLLVFSALIIILMVIYTWYILPIAALFYIISIIISVYYKNKLENVG